MKTISFNVFASLLFGTLTLYAVYFALPNAFRYPRELVGDGLRFGSIAIAFACGLALVLPHRTFPAIKEIAQRISPHAVRFIFGIGLVSCLLVMRLSGEVSFWVAAPITCAVVTVLVFPGFALFGLPDREGLRTGESRALSLREISDLVRKEKFERSAAAKTVGFALMIVVFGGSLSFIFAPSVIAAPLWAQASNSIAFIGAAFTSFIMFYMYWSRVPPSAKRDTLPNLFFWTILTFVLLTVIFRSFFIQAMPLLAAKVWGQATVQQVQVLQSRPVERRRGCSGLLVIQTINGAQDVCNFPQEFLKSISPNDTLYVFGKATVLGQIIEGLRLVE